MSLITKNNYEAYLLDYVEGNLTPELTAELMLFFENNPTLKEEFDDFEVHQLVPETTILSDKQQFKKNENSISIDNYDTFFIAEIEGENSTEASQSLATFLAQYPEKQIDFEAYQKTKLIAPSLIFENKKALKKKEEKVIPIHWWYASAAAVIIIFFLLNGLNNEDKKEELPIADKKESLIVPQQQEVRVVKQHEIPKPEKQMAMVKKERLTPTQKKNEKVKEVVKEVKQEFVVENILTEEIIDQEEMVKDTVPAKIKNEEPLEEIKYADNVKITFEDDEPIYKAKDNAQTAKKKFIEQDRNADGEVTAYAINIGGFSFSKNKRKKTN